MNYTTEECVIAAQYGGVLIEATNRLPNRLLCFDRLHRKCRRPDSSWLPCFDNRSLSFDSRLLSRSKHRSFRPAQ